MTSNKELKELKTDEHGLWDLMLSKLDDDGCWFNAGDFRGWQYKEGKLDTKVAKIPEILITKGVVR